jgi:hypothetical protein
MPVFGHDWSSLLGLVYCGYSAKFRGVAATCLVWGQNRERGDPAECVSGPSIALQRTHPLFGQARRRVDGTWVPSPDRSPKSLQLSNLEGEAVREHVRDARPD